jgi:exopolysaccharide biosynthesis predicted pyruvyltransferase EpsI
MFSTEDPFIQFLKTRQGRRIYLKPYWGNAGDGLIWMGNEVILQELGMNQVLDPRQADIILWPGGNPTMYQGNLDGWQECWRAFPSAEFVVGPATFHGTEFDWRILLKGSKARLAGLFARDPESYRNLQELGLPSQTAIGLAHCPAFSLKGTAWIEGHRKAATAEYVLASFRGDRESAFKRPVDRKIYEIWPLTSFHFRAQRRRRAQYFRERLETVKRISGSNNVFESDVAMMSFHFFVETVRRASEVHTDRLHCMILAALLGKKVFAYPTAYAKLESVYQHSVASWALVQFVDDRHVHE